jgi:hypothetical protein
MPKCAVAHQLSSLFKFTKFPKDHESMTQIRMPCLTEKSTNSIVPAFGLNLTCLFSTYNNNFDNPSYKSIILRMRFFLYSSVSRNHNMAALLLCLLMKRIEIAETKDGRKALFISIGWATIVSSRT